MPDAPAVRYRRLHARSRELFDLLAEDAYYSQPIALRHPIVFYDGHLPGFAFNTLVRNALGGESIDRRLETLFARGIDPHESTAARAPDPRSLWPTRDQVRRFAEEADARVIETLERPDLRERAPEAVGTILEHEAMHQETLLYMWHQLPLALKHRPAGYEPLGGGDDPVPPQEWVDVPAGCATLGAARGSIPFGWDNEFRALSVDVAGFQIERHDVTNARFLEFVDDGGYRDERWWRPADWPWIQSEGVTHPTFWEREGARWMWRGQFDLVPLPLAWPAYVSQAEACAFARWSGARLPTEAEYHRAAFGSAEGEQRYPWGDEEPSDTHGVFDFSRWDPAPAGSHPAGASAWGVHDLMGNGWEWTATPFAPFPGFAPMRSYPQYSADFFDGDHFVMKGASPVTAKDLLRRSLRNWFRPRYPYVYATFRCARDGAPRHG